MAHWVWAPGGWLRAKGVLDFAGGTVVHINAAAAAIVGALLLGKRRGLKAPTTLPHNVPFVILGAGCSGSAGSASTAARALAANGLASYAFANTFFAPAAAAAAWGLAELFFFHGKMSGVGLASGAVAGMVAITPAVRLRHPRLLARHRRAGRPAPPSSPSGSGPASGSTTPSTSSPSTAWPPPWVRSSPASSPPSS